ncbi:hypothetical protein KA093_02725 [Candidatus Saccharibacteria bacterium]|nr:hypothetical protein [Candidatus Saccharibacteria bacterium]
MAQDRYYEASRGSYQVRAWLMDINETHEHGMLIVHVSPPIHTGWEKMVAHLFEEISIEEIHLVVTTATATMVSMWLDNVRVGFLAYADKSRHIIDGLEILLRLLVEIDTGDVCPIH